MSNVVKRKKIFDIRFTPLQTPPLRFSEIYELSMYLLYHIVSFFAARHVEKQKSDYLRHLINQVRYLFLEIDKEIYHQLKYPDDVSLLRLIFHIKTSFTTKENKVLIYELRIDSLSDEHLNCIPDKKLAQFIIDAISNLMVYTLEPFSKSEYLSEKFNISTILNRFYRIINSMIILINEVVNPTVDTEYDDLCVDGLILIYNHEYKKV